MSQVENRSYIDQVDAHEKIVVISTVLLTPIAIAMMVIGADAQSPAVCLSGIGVLMTPNVGYSFFLIGSVIKDVHSKKPIKLISTEVATSSEETRVFNK